MDAFHFSSFGATTIFVKEHTIHLKNIPDKAVGMRFALVTDLHIGGQVDNLLVSDVVDKVNNENVDAIFLVGDVVDAPYKVIKDRTEPMKHFKSKLGTFMVTGNHEYYYGDYQEWLDAFTNEYGFKVLLNNVTDIEGICLVGLIDISAEKNGLVNHTMDASVVKVCDPLKPIIVLAHNPASVPQILDVKTERAIDLILTGHTHAGQFYIMIPYVLLYLPYFYGFYSVGVATTLFVSAGTLFQAAAFKMLGFAEIHIFTVTR
uniref:Metallophos domain-containing protein n=1 Tax=Rhabditophanes sp. KR3021 TaxID=114890 RepID=A0AC35TQI4_9BILA